MNAVPPCASLVECASGGSALSLEHLGGDVKTVLPAEPSGTSSSFARASVTVVRFGRRDGPWRPPQDRVARIEIARNRVPLTVSLWKIWGFHVAVGTRSRVAVGRALAAARCDRAAAPACSRSELLFQVRASLPRTRPRHRCPRPGLTARYAHGEGIVFRLAARRRAASEDKRRIMGLEIPKGVGFVDGIPDSISMNPKNRRNRNLRAPQAPRRCCRGDGSVLGS